MIDPTMTGCFRKPLKNTPQAPNSLCSLSLIRLTSGVLAILLFKLFLRLLGVLLEYHSVMFKHVRTCSRPAVALFRAMTVFTKGTIAVIFCAQRTEEDDTGYGVAADQDGTAGLPGVRISGDGPCTEMPDGSGITISYWATDEDAKAWRDHPEHATLSGRSGRGEMVQQLQSPRGQSGTQL